MTSDTKTYIYVEANGSATVTLSAPSDEAAELELRDIVKHAGAFRLDSIEEED